ncbi:hypothetical protein CNMCM5623_004250 [Aspergillus felis]|uniref:Major facilitator superfamily (MFS) profile domain-containing protein n=1 Tax=Aspergillus felis TaxID=1287682 RepID=A0A8H6QDW7_9EURO|nr:hypothetical protein CNMCM5623_004250 [Aspergillus felis]
MGRRWCIIIANTIITLGCLVNTFATSIGMWCGEKIDDIKLPADIWKQKTFGHACSFGMLFELDGQCYLSPIPKSVGVTAPVQITLINSGLALWNLLLAVIAAVYCDTVGRRPLFLTSVAGMLCSYVVVMGLFAGFANTKHHALGIAVIPFLFIIRSKGMALFTSTATLANTFNQFVKPIALKAIAWRYYAIYIAILGFYFCFIFFMFPETKHLSAEEASRIFDYDRKGFPLERLADDVEQRSVILGNGKHGSESAVEGKTGRGR